MTDKKKKNKNKKNYELLPHNFFDRVKTDIKYNEIKPEQLKRSINLIKMEIDNEINKNNKNNENNENNENIKKIGLPISNFFNDSKNIVKIDKSDVKQLQQTNNELYNENDYIFLKKNDITIFNINYDEYDII